MPRHAPTPDGATGQEEQAAMTVIRSLGTILANGPPRIRS